MQHVFRHAGVSSTNCRSDMRELERLQLCAEAGRIGTSPSRFGEAHPSSGNGHVPHSRMERDASAGAGDLDVCAAQKPATEFTGLQRYFHFKANSMGIAARLSGLPFRRRVGSDKHLMPT